jgi:hypothetical protein
MVVKEDYQAVQTVLVLEKAAQAALEVVVLMAHYLLVEQLLQFLLLLEEEKQRRVLLVKVILILAVAEVAVPLKLVAQMAIAMEVMVQQLQLTVHLFREAAEAAEAVLKHLVLLAALVEAVQVEIILMVTELQARPILVEAEAEALAHLVVMTEMELMEVLALLLLDTNIKINVL